MCEELFFPTPFLHEGYYSIEPRSAYPFAICRPPLRVTLGFSVSGQNSLEVANDAGADMTEAVSRWEAET